LQIGKHILPNLGTRSLRDLNNHGILKVSKDTADQVHGDQASTNQHQGVQAILTNILVDHDSVDPVTNNRGRGGHNREQEDQEQPALEGG
jgi:hypothetical protein